MWPNYENIILSVTQFHNIVIECHVFSELCHIIITQANLTAILSIMNQISQLYQHLYQSNSNFKDAMPVSFSSDLFTCYILTMFRQWNLLP